MKEKLNIVKNKTERFKNKINILKGILGEEIMEYLIAKTSSGKEFNVKFTDNAIDPKKNDFSIIKWGDIEIDGVWHSCLIGNIKNEITGQYEPGVKVEFNSDTDPEVIESFDKGRFIPFKDGWADTYNKMLEKANENFNEKLKIDKKRKAKRVKFTFYE